MEGAGGVNDLVRTLRDSSRSDSAVVLKRRTMSSIYVCDAEAGAEAGWAFFPEFFGHFFQKALSREIETVNIDGLKSHN